MTIKTRFNVSFILLLFSALLTGLVIIALLAKTAPLLVAKAVYFCRQFISSNTLFQIPQSLPGILIFLLGTVLLLGIISFLLQVYKTKLLVNKLLQKRVPQPLKLCKTAKILDLDNKIVLVEDNNLFSFCYGMFFPRILITTTLVSSLEDKELEAVLLHEKAHLQSFDPFKILLGKAIASMFFFLPIFGELNNNMSATNEILADRYVLEHQRETPYLKNALKKILTNPQIKFATVPAISDSDYLEIRIKRLAYPAVKHNFGVSWISILTSLLFFVLSWFLLQTEVSAFKMEPQTNPSYFLCSSDNVCRQECQGRASVPAVTTMQDLFPFQSERLIYKIKLDK